MKWLDKGVLNYDGRDYGYGDDLPKDFPKEFKERLIKAGSVGDLPEKIVPSDLLKEAQAENETLRKKIATLEKKVVALEKKAK